MTCGEDEIRTRNLRIDNPLLYLIELQHRFKIKIKFFDFDMLLLFTDMTFHVDIKCEKFATGDLLFFITIKLHLHLFKNLN